MATTQIKKALRDVAGEGLKSQPWFRHLEDIECFVSDYEFGEEILLGEESPSLGFIISGTAEICDESRLEQKYLAYRPIRLIRENEFFGDFPIADKVLGISKPPAKERWRLYAGRRSIIVLEKVRRIDRFSDEHYPDIRSPHLYITQHSKHCRTRIAVVQDLALFRQDSPFFHEMLCSAWQKASAYRFGLNSYNLIDLFVFRRVVAEQWDRESSRIDKSAPDKFDKKGNLVPSYIHPIPRLSLKSIQSIFADALFDALQRPLRGDPIFAFVEDGLSEACLALLRTDVSDVTRVLVASMANDCGPDPFYYPIDLYNLEINAFCVEHELASEGKIALGSERRKNRETPQEGDDTTKPRKFFKILTERVLGEFYKKPENANYPFEIICLDEPCLDGRMLVLQYRRRQARP